ncbi:MAG: hypothetical protein KDN22_26495 [Verrucomicrobiae bacterium]|nr:hypothetical protein [Verrucomicrobiae bacterium]
MSAIPFRPYNERAETRVYYHGILPHWRQTGCTYFVTFRLADSLPQSVVLRMEADRRAWLVSHGIDPESPDWKQEFIRLPREQQREYERELAIAVNEHLDCGYGSCELRMPGNTRIVADGLTHSTVREFGSETM